MSPYRPVFYDDEVPPDFYDVNFRASFAINELSACQPPQRLMVQIDSNASVTIKSDGVIIEFDLHGLPGIKKIHKNQIICWNFYSEANDERNFMDWKIPLVFWNNNGRGEGKRFFRVHLVARHQCCFYTIQACSHMVCVFGKENRRGAGFDHA